MRDVNIPRRFEQLILQYGKDFSLVQGLGGNCSVKTVSHMKVKASGKRMSGIRESDFFYEVALTKTGFTDDVRGQSGKPSIEVYLHALLPFRYVLHLHSTKAIAYSMQNRFTTETATGSFGSQIHLLPYARPGHELMDNLRGMDFETNGFSSILQNHGIVVAANSVSKLGQRLREVQDLATPKFRVIKGHLAPNMQNRELPLELREHALWHAEWNWRATPDHVVFLGITPDPGLLSALGSCASVKQLTEELSRQGKSSTQQEQGLWFLALANLLPRKRLQVLSEREAEYLQGWEPEKLRISKSQSESRE